MISVVILESRSPGSVVLTKRGHPELAACKVRPAGGYPAVITKRVILNLFQDLPIGLFVVAVWRCVFKVFLYQICR